MAAFSAAPTVWFILRANVMNQKEDGTDEEDAEVLEDYIGDRLARARLEATGQLYREVKCVLAQLPALFCFRDRS